MGISALILLMLSCCDLPSELDPTAVSPRGLKPSLETLNFGNVADAQSKFLNVLKLMAGVTGANGPKDDASMQAVDWQSVTKAGMGFVGGQCNEYLAALFRFDRDHRALRTGLTATGVAAATIMGLSATPAAPIAATAAVFGLATSYFDANVNSVVYDIGPAAVRNIVVQSQDAYRSAVLNNIQAYSSRPDVVLSLQGYLQICTPVAIEAAVEQASAATKFQTTDQEGEKNTQPALRQTSTQAPAVVALPATVSDTLANTNTTQRIKAWLVQGGAFNVANVEKLDGWVNSQTIDPSLNDRPGVLILNAGGKPGESSPSQMEADRAQAVSDLKIP